MISKPDHSNSSNGKEVSLASETTLLLSEQEESISAFVDVERDDADVASPNGSSDDELVKPWPATFGRTIAILAGPHFGNAAFIDEVTRSPKLTPLFLAQRGKKRFTSAKGSVTPEITGLRPSEREFQKVAKKYHSLDFPSKGGVSSKDEEIEHKLLDRERKSLEAKAYRLKILGVKGKVALKDDATETHSPGYHREKETDKFRKEGQKEEASSLRNATFLQCVFNLSNALMGVGILGLPFVFKAAGWIGGLFATLTFGAVTWRTSTLIGRELNGDPRPCHTFNDNPYTSPTVPGSSSMARMRKPISSFPDIAREAFGDRGCICLSSVLYFELFSCLCIFLVAIGDHLHEIFPTLSVIQHMSIAAIALTIPTALLHTPRLLSYLSAVGTVATISVVLSVVFCAFYAGDLTEQLEAADQGGVTSGDGHKRNRILWDSSGLPIAFGLIAYTFSGHAVFPSIYGSMARPQDYERAVDATYAVVIPCCLLVAISGYFMFGSFVEDEVTISLIDNAGPSAQPAMVALTWLMILTCFSKFTLSMFPVAIGMEELLAPFLPNEQAMEIAAPVIKLVFIGLALLVGIFVPSFGFICTLVGLVCTIVVSVILPAAAHLKLFGPVLPIWEKVLDWIFVIGGALIAVVGTFATLTM